MSPLTFALTAFVTSMIHTISGPDHYLPLIALGKSREWSRTKTIFMTIGTGFLHVLGSILLGLFGILLGTELELLKDIEFIRGNFASWVLLIFGVTYTIWGIYRGGHHKHNNLDPKSGKTVSGMLFLIFAVGPVEHLIPLFMIPAANYGIGSALFVGGMYLLGTVLTMLTVVLASLKGLKFIPHKFHQHGHTIAGAVLTVSGLAMVLGF